MDYLNYLINNLKSESENPEEILSRCEQKALTELKLEEPLHYNKQEFLRKRNFYFYEETT